MTDLTYANKAADEAAIRKDGHLVAIARPRREDTAVRRASVVLGQHWFGGRKVDPALADGLRIWALLHGGAA